MCAISTHTYVLSSGELNYCIFLYFNFQGGEDPDFICKAIESLVKKLKDRREQLYAAVF